MTSLSWLPGRRTGSLRDLGRRSRGARIALLFLGVVVLASVLAPLVAPYGRDDIDVAQLLAGPSGSHLFGTDDLGRDLFSRVLYGGQLSLGIGAAGTAIALSVGLVWGSAAALGGQWLDDILMRMVDAFLGIPILLSALVFIAAFQASALTLIIILGALHAPATARVIRAAILVEKTSPYCLAATAAGASKLRLMRNEILPNIVPTLLVQGAIVAASVILTEAGLSFLGLGIHPPAASWGTLLFQGYQQLYASYWFIVFPGFAVLLTIWALNALSDHVQAALDPRVRRMTREKVA